MPRRRLRVELVPDSSAAVIVARARGVRPTALDTAGIQDVFTRDVLKRSIFSARTTHAGYLASLEKQVEAILAGRDPVQARAILKGQLTRLEYDPETGFPGDEGRGIPPARPGSITDLSSNARLDLILRTQVAVVEGRAQQLAGLEERALREFPAWELIRAGSARVPRDWIARWQKAGGKVRRDTRGRMRLAALKTDAIWKRLGDPARFADALKTDHPPFAYNSNMIWTELASRECRALRLKLPDKKAKVKKPKALPAAVMSTAKLSPRMRAALEKALAEVPHVRAGKRVAMKSTAATDAPPPPPKSKSRGLAQAAREAFNALLVLY